MRLCIYDWIFPFRTEFMYIIEYFFTNWILPPSNYISRFFSQLSLVGFEGCEIPEIKITTCNEIHCAYVRHQQSDFLFQFLEYFIAIKIVLSSNVAPIIFGGFKFIHFRTDEIYLKLMQK